MSLSSVSIQFRLNEGLMALLMACAVEISPRVKIAGGEVNFSMEKGFNVLLWRIVPVLSAWLGDYCTVTHHDLVSERVK